MASMTAPTYGEMRSNAQRIVDEQVKSVVLAGMAALQERYPDTWQTRIDPDTLILDSPNCCVLAQTFDEGVLTEEELRRTYNTWHPEPYWKHLHALNGEVERDPVAFGFNEPMGKVGEDGLEFPYTFDDLTAAWRLVLTGEEQS